MAGGGAAAGERRGQSRADGAQRTVLAPCAFGGGVLLRHAGRRRGRLSRFCNRRDVRPLPRYTLVDAGRHSYSWCFYAGRHSMRSLRVRMQTC